VVQVKTAIVVQMVRFHDENLQETYTGIIKTNEDGEIPAYIKLLDQYELMVECICAVLGKRLGLPIPQPFLVVVPHKILPEKISESEQYKFAFGSQDAAYPSLRRSIQKNISLEKFVWGKLANFHHSFSVAGFDEWIVNDDRNIGNILFDGNGSFTFIDHERALPKEYPLKEITNQNLMFEIFQWQGRSVLPSEIKKFVADCDEIPTTLLADDVPPLKHRRELIEMAMFTSQRVEYLEHLITTKLAA
jgi:hypothetical protein